MNEKGNIAYLLKMFPRFSETFILNEILEMERQNIALHIFSIKKPNEPLRQGQTSNVKSNVTYMPWPKYILPPLAFRNAGAMWLILKANFRLYRLDSKRYRRTLTQCLRDRRLKSLKHFLCAGWLASAMLDAKIDHLHAHFANEPTTLALYVHQLTGLPFSFTAHAKDIYLSDRSTLKTKIDSSSFVVTCTGANRKHLLDISSSETPIHTIYHGIDWDVFRSARDSIGNGVRSTNCSCNGRRKGEPLILSVGRLVEKKGFDCLLDACGRLSDWGINFKCEIVGDGPLEVSLREKIHGLELEDKVKILNFIPHEELVHKYAQADVFALPCQITKNGDRDGIPNVLVEAMAVGLPVVSTDVSGIAELVEPMNTGYVVPPKKPDVLAKTLKEILLRLDTCDKMQVRAKKKVMAEFDLKANTSRFIEILMSDQTERK